MLIESRRNDGNGSLSGDDDGGAGDDGRCWRCWRCGDSGGDTEGGMMAMVRRACFCAGACGTQLRRRPVRNSDTMGVDGSDGDSEIKRIYGPFALATILTKVLS